MYSWPLLRSLHPKRCGPRALLFTMMQIRVSSRSVNQSETIASPRSYQRLEIALTVYKSHAVYRTMHQRLTPVCAYYLWRPIVPEFAVQHSSLIESLLPRTCCLQTTNRGVRAGSRRQPLLYSWPADAFYLDLHLGTLQVDLHMCEEHALPLIYLTHHLKPP